MRGGVADYTAFLARALVRQDTRVEIVTAEKALSQNTALGNSFLERKTELGEGGLELFGVSRWDYSCLKRLRQIIQSSRPDIVHIQYQTGAFGMHPAINLFPLALRARRNRPMIAVTFHDLKTPYLFPKAGKIREIANLSLILGSDALFTTNAEDTARLVLPRGNNTVPSGDERAGRFGARLFRLPIGSNIAVNPPPSFQRLTWRERLNVGPDETLLCYFGFLGPSKGVDLLLRAIEILGQRGRAVKLAMIGGSSGDTNSSDRPYEKSIRDLADAHSLRGKVIWTGFTASEEVSANLLASDICVLPFREGASLRHGTLIAAIAHGLPIITTEPDPLPPLSPNHRLISGENCLLVPAAKEASDEAEMVERLVMAVEALIANEELRQKIARGASALEHGFTWENIAAQSLQAYEAMLAG